MWLPALLPLPPALARSLAASPSLQYQCSQNTFCSETFSSVHAMQYQTRSMSLLA